MPTPRHLVFTYKLAVARGPKMEAEFFPTLTAIHTAGGLPSGGGPGLAEQGFALGVEALKNLDPETARYTVTRIGNHETPDTAGDWHGRIPVMERHGWRIYLDWGLPVE